MDLQMSAKSASILTAAAQVALASELEPMLKGEYSTETIRASVRRLEPFWKSVGRIIGRVQIQGETYDFHALLSEDCEKSQK